MHLRLLRVGAVRVLHDLSINIVRISTGVKMRVREGPVRQVVIDAVAVAHQRAAGGVGAVDAGVRTFQNQFRVRI